MSPDPSFEKQMGLLSLGLGDNQGSSRTRKFEELRMTPLLSYSAMQQAEQQYDDSSCSSSDDAFDYVFPQYGLLCGLLHSFEGEDGPQDDVARGTTSRDDPRLFLNVDTPWSTFICGSQGSGKSHTLSCMLENCILPSSRLGKLPKPLAGLVFHYDKFNSYHTGKICEVAYLCSAGISVRVLVSPTNYWSMKRAYENIPGVDSKHQPVVRPLLLQEKHLSIDKMMRLMAVSENDGPLPLYMEMVRKVLRQMAKDSQGAPGLDYNKFRDRLKLMGFTERQLEPLNLRLELLESFMEVNTAEGRTKKGKGEGWQFPSGSLTIIDLSCPFVDDAMACVLFDICLSLFLEQQEKVGRVVALDEAHKFMTDSTSARNFTDSLLSVIRLQRHLGTRVIISTQEPTISPRLLELSSMTFVHRFTSPKWLEALRSHLAGASSGTNDGQDGKKRDVRKVFETIVNLDVGEALVFSPSAVLSSNDTKTSKLGMSYVKVRVRKRLTADGGKSMLAS